MLPGSGTTAVTLSTPNRPLMKSPIVEGNAELNSRKSITFAKSVASGCGELIGVRLAASSEKNAVCH